MNIALCTDDKYVIPCMVTIASIFENNKLDKCNVYVLTDSLTDENQLKFRKLALKYQQHIYITKVDINTYSDLKVTNSFPKAMYYRFLLPSILNDLDKVLYLDCDIIVRHSLKDLFEFDITPYSCAAVEDANADNVLHKNKIKYLGEYFNSGVLLMNLDYWRKHNTASILVNFIEEEPERCIFPDQDALNINLQNSVYFLPYSYNMQNAFIRRLEEMPFLYTKHEAVKECRMDPIILHFSSWDKPWFVECNHPYKDEWRHYAKCAIGFDYRQSYRLPFSTRIRQATKQFIKNLIR